MTEDEYFKIRLKISTEVNIAFLITKGWNNNLQNVFKYAEMMTDNIMSNTLKATKEKFSEDSGEIIC